MYTLTYISSALQPLSTVELVELLNRSRAKNTRLGITGMLLYKSGSFMQVLEGDETTVRRLYFDEIARDFRHHHQVVLLEQQQPDRDFTAWSMGFYNLDSPELRDLPGYSEILNVKLTDPSFFSDPTRAQRLLLSFRSVVR